MQTRAGNLLGASPNSVADRVQRQTEAVAGRSGGRVAALATLAQWLGDTTEELRHSLGLSHSATAAHLLGPMSHPRRRDRAGAYHRRDP